MDAKADRPVLGRAHRALVGLIGVGALVIAGIGFAGSYTAVRRLATKEGFGWYSYLLPVAIDSGIVVLLSLDLLLTWLRIPFPLLRHTAWLLTAATIVFNAAAAWPNPLAMAMHAAAPVLFVTCLEAARHAIGRIADITAERYMEPVRIVRWLLAFPTTWRLWRHMRVWELRSYDAVIRLEQDRLIYKARLRGRYGRAWRRRAPVEALMPLRLARYGAPIAETMPKGLAAAGLPPLDSLTPPPSSNTTQPTPPAPRPEVPSRAVVPVAEKRRNGSDPAEGGRRRSATRGDLAPPPAQPPATSGSKTERRTGDQRKLRQRNDLLKARFDALPPAERALPDAELARLLWKGSGYTVGTVRKKLAEIKKSSGEEPGT